MKRLGDSEQLKVLLHSFQAILDDPTRSQAGATSTL